jgi:hypothetical protein
MSGSDAAGGEIVEVMLSWGGDWRDGGQGSVLGTKYLRPGERFSVGERKRKGTKAGEEGCDALVPSEVLGATEADLVMYGTGGALVLPPSGAQVWVDAFPAPAGPITLARDQVVEVAIGAFTLRARLVESEAFVSAFAPAEEASKYGGFALSALAHVSCLAALALFLPALGATDDEEITRDQLLTMQHLLSASAEREEEAKEAEVVAPAEAAEDHGASGGGRAIGKAGAMGTPNAPQAAGHWSAAGDNPRELQSLSHEEKQALVKDFGMLGLLATMNADPNAPTVPWGDVLGGADRESHLGALFGPDPADSWGIGGLALGRNDEGGGGNNLGTGINDVGELSQSLDRRIGGNDPGGFGHGCGGKPCFLGRHEVGAKLRMPREIVTNGHLPGEVIQRIIRQNAGRFRACYEGGLRTNPSLEGRVEVRFIIDRQGQVSVAQDGASDLPNAAVRSCIVKSFYALSFPSPDNGTVTVVYPIALTPAS